MELKIIKPKIKDKVKLTLQKSGKLGFSKGASKSFNLEKNRFVRFGTDDNNEMYLLLSETHEEYSFNVAKAGGYFYIKKDGDLIEALGVKLGDTITFDLCPTKECSIFKLEKRFYTK